MSELSDFIAQRKATLIARRDKLEAELAPIRAELSDIASIERAMSGPTRSIQGSARGPSIKSLILGVLDGTGQPMTAAEIRQRIHGDGRDIPRETFSPQLSRLVLAGQVIREGTGYRSAAPPAPLIKSAEA